jgi:hypothetical protein
VCAVVLLSGCATVSEQTDGRTDRGPLLVCTDAVWPLDAARPRVRIQGPDHCNGVSQVSVHWAGTGELVVLAQDGVTYQKRTLRAGHRSVSLVFVAGTAALPAHGPAEVMLSTAGSGVVVVAFEVQPDPAALRSGTCRHGADSTRRSLDSWTAHIAVNDAALTRATYLLLGACTGALHDRDCGFPARRLFLVGHTSSLWVVPEAEMESLVLETDVAVQLTAKWEGEGDVEVVVTGADGARAFTLVSGGPGRGVRVAPSGGRVFVTVKGRGTARGTVSLTPLLAP